MFLYDIHRLLTSVDWTDVSPSPPDLTATGASIASRYETIALYNIMYLVITRLNITPKNKVEIILLTRL